MCVISQILSEKKYFKGTENIETANSPILMIISMVASKYIYFCYQKDLCKDDLDTYVVPGVLGNLWYICSHSTAVVKSLQDYVYNWLRACVPLADVRVTNMECSLSTLGGGEFHIMVGLGVSWFYAPVFSSRTPSAFLGCFSSFAQSYSTFNSWPFVFVVFWRAIFGGCLFMHK